MHRSQVRYASGSVTSKLFRESVGMRGSSQRKRTQVVIKIGEAQKVITGKCSGDEKKLFGLKKEGPTYDSPDPEEGRRD